MNQIIINVMWVTVVIMALAVIYDLGQKFIKSREKSETEPVPTKEELAEWKAAYGEKLSKRRQELLVRNDSGVRVDKIRSVPLAETPVEFAPYEPVGQTIKEPPPEFMEKVMAQAPPPQQMIQSNIPQQTAEPKPDDFPMTPKGVQRINQPNRQG